MVLLNQSLTMETLGCCTRIAFLLSCTVILKSFVNCGIAGENRPGAQTQKLVIYTML